MKYDCGCIATEMCNMHQKAPERIADLWSENQRLWQPMECGHPGACYSPLPTLGNEPPPKDWPPDCLECRAIAAAKIEGLRRAKEIMLKNYPAMEWRQYERAIDAEIAALERGKEK